MLYLEPNVICNKKRKPTVLANIFGTKEKLCHSLSFSNDFRNLTSVTAAWSREIVGAGMPSFAGQKLVADFWVL